jgi:iron complex transport system substrate-binding protein
MLEAAGAVNVLGDIDRESVQATTELVLARAPDVILEVRSGDIDTPEEAAREARSWTPLASVPAVRNRRVIVLTGQGLTVPGPRVAQVVEQMFQALHPGR